MVHIGTGAGASAEATTVLAGPQATNVAPAPDDLAAPPAADAALALPVVAALQIMGVAPGPPVFQPPVAANAAQAPAVLAAPEMALAPPVGTALGQPGQPNLQIGEATSGSLNLTCFFVVLQDIVAALLGFCRTPALLQ